MRIVLYVAMMILACFAGAIVYRVTGEDRMQAWGAFIGAMLVVIAFRPLIFSRKD